jgi:hypothetical protein
MSKPTGNPPAGFSITKCLLQIAGLVQGYGLGRGSALITDTPFRLQLSSHFKDQSIGCTFHPEGASIAIRGGYK